MMFQTPYAAFNHSLRIRTPPRISDAATGLLGPLKSMRVNGLCSERSKVLGPGPAPARGPEPVGPSRPEQVSPSPSRLGPSRPRPSREPSRPSPWTRARGPERVGRDGGRPSPEPRTLWPGPEPIPEPIPEPHRSANTESVIRYAERLAGPTASPPHRPTPHRIFGAHPARFGADSAQPRAGQPHRYQYH